MAPRIVRASRQVSRPGQGSASAIAAAGPSPAQDEAVPAPAPAPVSAAPIDTEMTDGGTAGAVATDTGTVAPAATTTEVRGVTQGVATLNVAGR